MPEAADEELAKGLRDARKQPRNFVAIIKGTNVLKLVVRKKEIKSAEIQSLRTELKGTAALSGVVQVAGGEHVFETLEDPPDLKIQPLKDYIDADTGLKVKPRFAKVTALAEVPQMDDVPVAPPMPTGKPPQAPLDQAIAGLVAAMQKLRPALQEALAAHPGLKVELMDLATNFQQQIKVPDAAAAKTTLIALAQRLKELPAPGTTPATSETPPEAPPAPGGDLARQWNEAHATAEPRYLAALKKGESKLTSELKVIFAYATERAEAGEYDKALVAIKRLLPLLEQAERGPGPQVSSRLVESRKFLLTRFQKIRADLKQELDSLQKAIAESAADDDPTELTTAMQGWFDRLLDELQNGIDASINAGDDFQQAQEVIHGLQAEVDDDELIEHLLENPLIDGEQFVSAINGGLDDIATELRASVEVR